MSHVFNSDESLPSVTSQVLSSVPDSQVSDSEDIYSNSVDQIYKIVPILGDKNIYIKKRAKIFQEIENISSLIFLFYET